MYFIISGLLFYVSYQKKIGDGKYSFTQFLTKRVLRVYPLMIVTSLVMYGIQLCVFHSNHTFWSMSGNLSLPDLLLDLLFVGKSWLNQMSLNGPIWYLNVLMICYIWAFGLTKLFYKLKNFLVFTVPIILGLIWKLKNLRLSLCAWRKVDTRRLCCFLGI